MKMVRRTIALLALGAAMGCTSNPYPDQGQYFTSKPTTNVVPLPYGLDVDDVVDLREGVQKDIPIKGHVPSDKGTPVITVDQIPQGATFNAATNTLSWKPGFN